MKSYDAAINIIDELSPSLGREWIEISISETEIIPAERLPPWGGSGLKSVTETERESETSSPSLGREWIEIHEYSDRSDRVIVSLLGEGVD